MNENFNKEIARELEVIHDKILANIDLDDNFVLHSIVLDRLDSIVYKLKNEEDYEWHNKFNQWVQSNSTNEKEE